MVKHRTNISEDLSTFSFSQRHSSSPQNLVEERSEINVDPTKVEDDPYDSDHMLALMLQQQFTDDFNTGVKNYEAVVNRNSKGSINSSEKKERKKEREFAFSVKISMKNYLLSPVSAQFEDDSDLNNIEDLDREAISDCEDGWLS